MIVFRGPDGRLRAGWRLVSFVVGLGAVSTAATLMLRRLVGPVPGSPAVALALKGMLAAGVASFTVFLARRLLDRRSIGSIGLRKEGAAADFAFGFCISAAIVGGLVALLARVGWARVEIARLSAGQLVLLFWGTAAAVAWWEELVFRGYVLQNLEDGLGLRLAVLVSCLLYGIAHAFNPGATLLSAVVIAGIGFVRILGYLTTRQLWLSMGMHAGWNFVQSVVFGLPVSGRSTASWLATRLDGPAWVTGGSFGLEGGLGGVVYSLLSVGAILAWTRRARARRWPSCGSR